MKRLFGLFDERPAAVDVLAPGRAIGRVTVPGMGRY
jgi:hypothetical protein